MRPGVRPSHVIAADRRAAILANPTNKPLIPKGECHCCGWPMALKGAIWCGGSCATDYAEERAQLLGAK